MTWIIIAAAALLAGLTLVSYNALMRSVNLVQESWQQIDVELQRRHDLVPNLLATVKGYAAHERDTLQAVTDARVRAVAAREATPGERSGAEDSLTGALSRLMVISEAYPDLKSNSNYLAFAQQLADTEDRIAAARRLYNGNVRALNTRVATFPSAVFARMFSVQRAEYFELTDAAARTAPTVQF